MVSAIASGATRFMMLGCFSPVTALSRLVRMREGDDRLASVKAVSFYTDNSLRGEKNIGKREKARLFQLEIVSPYSLGSLLFLSFLCRLRTFLSAG
jgi:hypothetical protein